MAKDTTTDTTNTTDATVNQDGTNKNELAPSNQDNQTQTPGDVTNTNQNQTGIQQVSELQGSDLDKEGQLPATGTFVDLSVDATDEKPEDQPKNVGSIVHYVLDDGFSHGKHRPGIIVNSHQDAEGIDRAQIQVFTDNNTDYDRANATTHTGYSGLMLRDGVRYDADKSANSWHWPESDASSTKA